MDTTRAIDPKTVTPESEQFPATRTDRGECPYCHGNDRDVPCAYPSEGKPGCLRDARLAVEFPPRREDSVDISETAKKCIHDMDRPDRSLENYVSDKGIAGFRCTVCTAVWLPHIGRIEDV